jgi:transcriptional regulator with XRE-family HTH domain
VVGQRIQQARHARRMSLAQLAGEDLSRSFLSVVERGRSRISLRALAIVAGRLGLPVSYFVDDPVTSLDLDLAEPTVDHVEAALAYSMLLRHQGKLEQALDYALWAARARLSPPERAPQKRAR